MREACCCNLKAIIRPVQWELLEEYILIIYELSGRLQWTVRGCDREGEEVEREMEAQTAST